MNRTSVAHASAVSGFVALTAIFLSAPFVSIFAALGAMGLGLFSLKSNGRWWAIVGIICGCLVLLLVVASVALLFYEMQKYDFPLQP